MKKTLLHSITALLLLLSGFVFAGCQDPIFEAIREDVKPEEATVSGNISFITRYTAGNEEFLVLAADDGLRYKHKDANSHGEWHSYGTPFSLHHYDFDTSSHSGEQILAVLADSTTLYLISAAYNHTSVEGTSYPSSINLYAKNITATGTEWNSSGDWVSLDTKIDGFEIFNIEVNSTTKYFTSLFRVFQTNSPKKEHRAAFISSYDSDNKVYKYFKLNGTSAPESYTITDTDIIDPTPSSDADYVPRALSAVYFNGGYKFFTSTCATTNETYTDEATYYYYTNSDSTFYCNNGSANVKEVKTKTVISSMAICADSILIGHGYTYGISGGIERAPIINGVPKDDESSSSFETNAQFQLTEAYMILALLNATPEKTEIDSSLYASITFSGAASNFDNIGLWSYYPDRGNWNRE